MTLRRVELNNRSLNAELAEGMSDARYRKIVTDRGGDVDPATWANRRDLDQVWYGGIHEVRTKVLGDGTEHVTPDFVATPVARYV